MCLWLIQGHIFLVYLGDWTEHVCIYPYRKPTNASNDHFVVMSSQMLLHVSAYQRHHQGAHTILTSYSRVYVGVHYKKNNGVSNNIACQYCYTMEMSGYG
jgi:hypothetical protein